MFSLLFVIIGSVMNRKQRRQLDAITEEEPEAEIPLSAPEPESIESPKEPTNLDEDVEMDLSEPVDESEAADEE